MLRLKNELELEGFCCTNGRAGGTPTSHIWLSILSLKSEQAQRSYGIGQTVTTPYLDFLNAAVLVSRVISRPTPNRICLDIGHKAVASEMAQPRVIWFGLENA